MTDRDEGRRETGSPPADGHEPVAKPQPPAKPQPVTNRTPPRQPDVEEIAVRSMPLVRDLPRASVPDDAAVTFELYDRHQAVVYGFALGATRDPAAAEDLTQDAFLKLLGQVRTGVVPDEPRAWLIRVVANAVVSRGRRQTVARRLMPRLVGVDVAESPEASVLRREHTATVDRALRTLEPDERTVILLAAAGFRGHEIAQAIGRSDGATRTLLCRTRLRIQRLLDEEEA